MMAITARQRAAPNFEIIPEDSRNKQKVRVPFFRKQYENGFFSLCSAPGNAKTRCFHFAPRPAFPKPRVFTCFHAFYKYFCQERCENASFSLCSAPGLSETARFLALCVAIYKYFFSKAMRKHVIFALPRARPLRSHAFPGVFLAC